MAQETLNRIKETEVLARQAVKDAQDQADTLISDAKDKALKYKEELLAKYRKDAAQKLEEAQSGRDEVLGSAQERAQAVVSQLENSLKDKKDAAVQMVIDFICAKP